MMFVISVSSADVVVALSGSCSHFIVVDDMQADDDIKAFFVWTCTLWVACFDYVMAMAINHFSDTLMWMCVCVDLISLLNVA